MKCLAPTERCLKGTFLSSLTAHIADSVFTLLRELPDEEGMVIKPCKSVYCMFMSIIIDVVYTDKQDRAPAVNHAMKPLCVGRIRRGILCVVKRPPAAPRAPIHG